MKLQALGSVLDGMTDVPRGIVLPKERLDQPGLTMQLRGGDVMHIRQSMVTIGLVSVLALLLEPCPSIAQTDKQFVDDTKEYLRKLEKLGFAGVVLVSKDGEPLVAQGYGLSDRENGVLWNLETVSDIGSITKQFTAAAILSLEERALLSVQDSITKYFDAVPDDKSTITLHQLLTHTSGIVDLDSAGDFDPIERGEFVRRILSQPLNTPPGDSYEYSNAGYSLLGAIIETLTGQSYEQFLRTTLFKRNGMASTGYLLPDWDTTLFAQGYTPDGSWGTTLRKPMAKDGPYWVLRANGGIHSTANDMLHWGNSLLDGKVLSQSSMERYWTPHVDEGDGSSYGYGWSITTTPNGEKVITHNGGNDVFFANMMIVPNQHLVCVFQTNIAAEMRVVRNIMANISQRFLTGEPYPETPELADASNEELSVYVGIYRMDETNYFEVKAEKSRLLITPFGRSAFSLMHSTDTVDSKRCEDLSARLDTIVTAFLVGNFGPMFEALNRKASLEQLQTRWNDRLISWELEFGHLKGFEVLGTALQVERDMTVVRFIFENGNADRAYVWDKDAEHQLLGYSVRGLDPVLSCVAVKGGAFASWDPVTGNSRPFRIETIGGRSHLRFGPQMTAFEALR